MMTARLLLALWFLFACGCNARSELRPFVSDGCSSFPEGTTSHNELWLNCCIEHDRAYWLGGTYEERLAADRKLKECVESAGEPEVAALMLAGVRVGGTPYLPTRFRWGFGWPWPRGYKALTKMERQQAEKLIERGRSDQSKTFP